MSSWLEDSFANISSITVVENTPMMDCVTRSEYVAKYFDFISTVWFDLI